MTSSRDRLDGRSEGGREKSFLLPVTEGEWGHVVRLLEDSEAVSPRAPIMEALDIVRSMWDARIDAQSEARQSGSDRPFPETEDEVAGEFHRSFLGNKRFPGKERPGHSRARQLTRQALLSRTSRTVSRQRKRRS